MNQLFHLWITAIRWFATIGVIAWFIAIPLTPLYGLLRPWTNAESKFSEMAIAGLPLMIGAGSRSERQSEEIQSKWTLERQRTYIIIPYSFYNLTIFTYSESTSSESPIVSGEIVESSIFLLLIPWLAAGAFTLWRAKRFMRRNEKLA